MIIRASRLARIDSLQILDFMQMRGEAPKTVQSSGARTLQKDSLWHGLATA
jgi:hypothetical protein